MNIDSCSLFFETIVETSSGRLDACAAREFELFTRSQFKQRVLSAERQWKIGKCLHMSVSDREIHIHIEYLPERPCSLEPENIPLDIVYEDADVLVVNKARGMIVHPGAGKPSRHPCECFFVSLPVEWELKESLRRAESFLPAPRHRSSAGQGHNRGSLFLPRTIQALNSFPGNSERGKPRRSTSPWCRELCMVPGRYGVSFGVAAGIGALFIHDKARGRAAHSLYKPLSDNRQNPFAGHSSYSSDPLPGGAHQLRVHMKYLGYPILGDPLYNPKVPSDLRPSCSMPIR